MSAGPLAEQTLRAGGLVLEPLTARHAQAMFEALADPALYRYIEARVPQSAEALRERYALLESRASADGTQQWLNWVVRPLGQAPVGYVQATVIESNAWVAYVIGSAAQGKGYATRATRAMIDHLARTCRPRRFLACVEAANEPSIRLLARLDFRSATDAEAAEFPLAATERLFVREAAPWRTARQ